MKNIFENAYFGKPYRTRNERKAILLQVHNCATLAIDFDSHTVTHDYKMDGTSVFNCHDLDIVGEWKEEINEEELAKNAEKYADEAPMTGTIPNGYNTPCFDECDIADAYKAGYREAKT